MSTRIESTHHLSGEPHERLCVRALGALQRAQVPALVGGAFALTHYTGIVRDTKDLDFFVREDDLPRALSVLQDEGFATSTPFPHWLAKAHSIALSMDIIFASGNGLGRVDDDWFRYAPDASLYGEPIRVVPVEELLCSKAFIMERERFDGADVAHLLRAQARTLDWERLIRRFSTHLPVLLSHLILFLYIYSDGADYLPSGLLEDLQRRALPMLAESPEKPVCRGTLLSREQYLVDVVLRGYEDPRLTSGLIAAPDLDTWTAAIDSH